MPRPKKTSTALRPGSERKAISPRISCATREWLIEMFSSPTAGAEWTLEWSASVLDRALYGLTGRFQKAELSALIDMYNPHSHHLTPRTSEPDYLALMVRDFESDGLAEKWGYKTTDLVSKVAALTILEAAALALWACAYWTTGYSLDKYVGELSAN